MSCIPQRLLFYFVFLHQTRFTSGVVNLRGAGASFPATVYKDWTLAYKNYRRNHVTLEMTYDVTSSSRGVKAIKEKGDVEYAASDSLLNTNDSRDFPDLVLFPSMAGSIVLGYNIPGLGGQLHLTREAIVGIYNGSIQWWNDSLIMESNSALRLPQDRIIVIARKDKSGTTNTFTSALSAMDAAWKTTYGSFSEGRNDNTNEQKWKEGVIEYFGVRTCGMTGLVSSLQNSIGYFSVADAVEANMPYAAIRNKAGNFVNASVETVQSAMEYYAGLTDNLTFDLSDAGSLTAYPFAGFTHLLLYRGSMVNCDSAKELVRFVYWVLTNEAQKKACADRQMVSLNDAMVTRIQKDVLETVTCNGENMWLQVMEDIRRETTPETSSDNAMVIAVSVSVATVILIICIFMVYFLLRRYKLQRLLNKKQWLIPIEDIVFYFDDNKALSSRISRFMRSTLSLTSGSLDITNDNQHVLDHVLQWPGKWQENQVGLRLLEVKQLSKLTKAMKEELVWFQIRVHHANVVRFFGLTELDDIYYVIGDYCTKGTLRETLMDTKFNLSNELKSSLAHDVASGMAYLHSLDYIHGCLESKVCLLDSRWQIKISDWEYIQLLSIYQPHVSPLQQLHNNVVTSPLCVTDVDKRELWTAPEVLKSHYTTFPSKAIDVYSFAIVLVEIYNRDDPYIEHLHLHKLSAKEITELVVQNGLRPCVAEETPISMRQIMEICWNDNPVLRPTFEQVLKLCRRSRTNRKNVIEAMMGSMEECVHNLEERLQDQSSEIAAVSDKLYRNMAALMPEQMVRAICEGRGGNMHLDQPLAVAILDVKSISISDRDMLTIFSKLLNRLEQISSWRTIFMRRTLCTSIIFYAGLFQVKTKSKEKDDIETGRALASAMVHHCLDIFEDTEINDCLKSSNNISLHIGVHYGKASYGLVGQDVASLLVLGSLEDETWLLTRQAENLCVYASQSFQNFAIYDVQVQSCFAETVINGKEDPYRTHSPTIKREGMSDTYGLRSGATQFITEENIQCYKMSRSGSDQPNLPIPSNKQPNPFLKEKWEFYSESKICGKREDHSCDDSYKKKEKPKRRKAFLQRWTNLHAINEHDTCSDTQSKFEKDEMTVSKETKYGGGNTLPHSQLILVNSVTHDFNVCEKQKQESNSAGTEDMFQQECKQKPNGNLHCEDLAIVSKSNLSNGHITSKNFIPLPHKELYIINDRKKKSSNHILNSIKFENSVYPIESTIYKH